MVIGLIKETKTPPDRRVAFDPYQVVRLKKQYSGLDIKVQSSAVRAITDEEYQRQGIEVVDSMFSCDVLFGIKEVKIHALEEGKTYLFFSHTGKKQLHNRDMFREMTRRKITLIDYEFLTDSQGIRVAAFGRWAGVVGAYNGLRAWGLRHGTFQLKPAHDCHDMAEMLGPVAKIKLPPIKILITGGGRVAHGAMETLQPLNLRKVKAGEFLRQEFEQPVLCRIDPDDYVRRKDGKEFSFDHFCAYPELYESTFLPFTRVTDMYMPCHYWDPRAPLILAPEDYLIPGFRIKVIADISCDINRPIASTIRPSTNAEPFYGYHPPTGAEGDAFTETNITVMAVDNLPGELPRDASTDFGESLIQKVLPFLIGPDTEGMIERATMLKKGELTPRYEYLRDYLEGKE
jgi:saccharopine dehydrogenase (NAD+, L-lysine-forming)